MRFSFDGYNYVVRLDRGERLSESLRTFVRQTELEGGWVSGLGGAQAFTLGFYDLDKKEYSWKEFAELHEIVSLNGNLALDEQGQLVVHLHGVFANYTYQTVGGHIKELVAAATVELFVHRTYQPLKRAQNEQVGLPTLNV